mmetsp:Transcript_24682/g.55823  ORF Transcript_24682/g.55823 Transcript_24682/m.55823 type:complete len:192 (-) Transcript_24682:100-675(-)
MENLIQSFRRRGVKAVVFDFDCTITLKHSGGRVHNDKVDGFLENNISPCFKELLPVLLANSFGVGVATFSDDFKVPSTYLAGEHLVRKHFEHFFGNRFTEQIPIIAAFPDVYQTEGNYKAIGLDRPMPQNKEYHLALLCARWNLRPHEVVLIDDDYSNVDAAMRHGYHAIFVRERNGLRAVDILESEQGRK